MQKTKIPFFRTFQAKVTLVLILSLFFVASLSNFLIYKSAHDAQLEQLREKLKVIARTLVLAIDVDLLRRVPLNPEGINSPAFKSIAELLAKIKEANPPIIYIYTMVKTEKEGIWKFVVDSGPFDAGDTKGEITFYPGDEYDAVRSLGILKAFDVPSADKEIKRDERGFFLSGYAPIRNKNGETVAMLGVDITTQDVTILQNIVYESGIFVSILGVILSVFLGMTISRRITRPINELVEATHRIAEGDLEHQVKVSGADEIAELASSFNQMARSLYDLRKKLLNYFYRVAQSLVRILEAKDHYTRGHSERVAEYSEKIAHKLGIPKERIEILKEAALFHDIGKIGIHENILNKKGKLTDAEWEIIQSHPIIGEDIIKPISLTEEMMAIVRGHHERYDGKGYPDKISGDSINLFAAIVSVADAYDAMISPRAYRRAFSKQETIEELKKNRGSQFQPKVIDVLIQILEKD
ncbi:MAG: HD domain-containing protein [Candidatus Omnitrophica bacterium]|nr:HD domain-containing protein [Candidatus Omnitrophota bacterium]